jgi:lipopolysaccharide/colanic/teichoic acid biosynthesis glycosyltransferase
MDLDYIRQQSFWFDMKLIMRTLLLVLMQRGSA